MDQSKKFKKEIVQVPYMGRWVPKDHFRVWVYNEKEERLANSWDEFQKLIGSGLWYESKEAVENAISLNLAKDFAEKQQKEPENFEKPIVSEKNSQETVSLNEFKSSKTKGK